MTHTFDTQTLSDLHKDARGFRPRGDSFWARWDESNDDGKQAIWDGLCDELTESVAADEAAAAEAVADFEYLVSETIKLGAGNRETALRWLTQGETFHHSQSVEGWVWEQGILFTDYGKKLLEELLGIVTYEEADDGV